MAREYGYFSGLTKVEAASRRFSDENSQDRYGLKDLSRLGYTAATLNQVEQIYGDLLRSLKRDVDRARPGVVLSRLGRSEGYLRNVWHGRSSISLRRFLEVIEATGSSPASFFERSLDTTPSAEAFLFAMESELSDRRLPEALREVIARGLTGSKPMREVRFDPRELVEELGEKSTVVQRRLLLRGKRFRRVDFLDCYLDHLDEMRFDYPRQVSRLAETVALKVIPLAYGDSTQCTRLFCRAAAVLASAERIKGRPANAAVVLAVALTASKLKNLSQMRAQLLVRASTVLADDAQYNRGLLLLREAQEIYFDRDEIVRLGQVLVNRAILFSRQGSYADSLRCYDRAFKILPQNDRSLRRWRMALHQGAALVHYYLDDLDQAEICLAEARGESSGESRHNLAKLLWLEGRVATKLGEYDRAEHSLQRAGLLFRTLSDNRALLTQLDQLEALLLQGRVFRARELADHMVSSLLDSPELRSVKSLAKRLQRAIAQRELTVSLVRRAQATAEDLLSGLRST